MVNWDKCIVTVSTLELEEIHIKTLYTQVFRSDLCFS
jgi:hypothetical protein